MAVAWMVAATELEEKRREIEDGEREEAKTVAIFRVLDGALILAENSQNMFLAF